MDYKTISTILIQVKKINMRINKAFCLPLSFDKFNYLLNLFQV